MKYSELISFQPIESTIQLIEAGEKEAAKKLVQTYVMSDTMAENMQAPVFDQLQMDEVVDNKGVLVVGNYGTGKSHLMSVISAIATDEENLQYLQNKNFAKELECIAGKFEVLRIEIGGVTMPLREMLFGYIQEDFQKRGIPFVMPDFANVKDNKKIIKDFMVNFEEKYPDKGYMIVVDEFLSYLTSRDERQIVLDLEFFRALGEMCSKSKLRVIFGVQEKIFDNPKFSFVSATLKKVSDRFTQMIITKEATSYVVSERILKKTPEQKAWIRSHLENFSSLYTGMSSRLEEFVDLYPIHPEYIDVFNKISVIETRHILKDISSTIKSIFNEEVPENAPGIFSFDSCWLSIKNNGMFKSDPMISKVVNASSQLEEIINRSFPKPAYKPLAIKIIYALSVHRLTTNGLDVQYGLTAENLKDDLCLYLQMPEQEAEFLLSIVSQTLRDIMTTVSGQFIIFNDANNQYYIDVDKIVDYEEKIKQRASVLAESELNEFFYKIVYACLEWDKTQYVPNFNIYEYDLNWDSHNMFREGYLFMGLPGDRSTAQPERDFYIHIMPPYADNSSVQNLDDEVYMYFKSTDEFKELIGLYSAAQLQAQISEGKDKEAYEQKSIVYKKKLIKFLGENKNTCFDVVYRKNKHQLIEVLKGRYRQDESFKDTIDLAASLCFDEYFNQKYPEYPVMKTKITRKNMADNARVAFDHFAGRKTQQSTMMLESFGVLDGDKIKPENSKYAAYYIDKVNQLSPQGVINYSDIFEPKFLGDYVDAHFQIDFTFTPIIFLSMVYGGYVEIMLKDGKKITASNLDGITSVNSTSLYEFKYLSRPAQTSLAEIKKLFEVIDLNPAELDGDDNAKRKAVEKLCAKAQELSNAAVVEKQKLLNGFELWNEPLVNSVVASDMQDACEAIKEEFSNYGAKYNTPAKLNNFRLSMDDISKLEKQVLLIKAIHEYVTFKTECLETVAYIANIEMMELGADFKSKIENAKKDFRDIRDNIYEGTSGEASARLVEDKLSVIKDAYIELYMDEHKKKRLDIKDAKRRGQILESKELGNLKKLRGIEILSTAKLSGIEQKLSSLKICYDLKKEDIKATPICPHCSLRLDDIVPNVFGQLDSVESNIDDLIKEWNKTLVDTLSDPLVASSKEYLSPEQKKVIDDFMNDRSLPEKVDDFFVKSIEALLKGFEPVVVDADELIQKLETLPPMDENSFKQNIDDLLKGYTKGKDASKLRIVVKRK